MTKTDYRITLPKTGLTKSSRFLLPLAKLLPESLKKLKIDGITRGGREILDFFGFYNVYLEDEEDLDGIRDGLVVIFNPSRDAIRKWHLFYEIYSKQRNFVKDYDIDVGVVALVFRVEEKYKYIRKAFLKGKYSEFGINYAKEFFITYNETTGKAEYITQFDIVTRDVRLRNKMEEELGVEIDITAELESPPILEQEIWNYKPKWE